MVELNRRGGCVYLGEIRRNDATRVDALIKETYPDRLIAPPQGRDQSGLHISMIPLKPQHRPPADPRRLSRVLERPFERRARHARLFGAKSRTVQNKPP